MEGESCRMRKYACTYGTGRSGEATVEGVAFTRHISSRSAQSICSQMGIGVLCAGCEDAARTLTTDNTAIMNANTASLTSQVVIR